MNKLKCKYTVMVIIGVDQAASPDGFIVGVTMFGPSSEYKDGYYLGNTNDGAVIEDATTGQVLIVGFELVKIVRGEA